MTKPISEMERKHAMNVALRQFGAGLDALPKHLVPEYMTSMATLCISMINGTLGRQFADWFLRGAVESLDQETVSYVMPTRN